MAALNDLAGLRPLSRVRWNGDDVALYQILDGVDARAVPSGSRLALRPNLQ
jgi:hypothetical protein